MPSQTGTGMLDEQNLFTSSDLSHKPFFASWASNIYERFQQLLSRSKANVDEEGNELEPDSMRIVNIGTCSKRKGQKYASNVCSTTRYTLSTFAPISLLEQYRRIANIYFTLAAFLTLTPFTPVNPLAAFLPLIFVLGVSIVKEGIEDLARHREDVKVNNRKSAVLDLAARRFVPSRWKDIKVGAIVEVLRDTAMPADLLLISTGEGGVSHGTCYVDTMNLDGETNLKVKQAPPSTRSLTGDMLPHLSGSVECEQPCSSLYHFTGNLLLSEIPSHPVNPRHQACSMPGTGGTLCETLMSRGSGNCVPPSTLKAKISPGRGAVDEDEVELEEMHSSSFQEMSDLEKNAGPASGQADKGGPTNSLPSCQVWPTPRKGHSQVGVKLPLGVSNLLLRGSVLRNTDRVYGLVLYAGGDTRMMRNSNSRPPSKRSQVDRILDRLMLFFFALLIIFTIIGASYNASWVNSQFPRTWYLGNQGVTLSQFDPNVPFIVFCANFITGFILYGFLVPITLYVSLEFVRIVQSKVFLENDMSMYYKESNTPAVARTSNLMEDLGMVHTILTDKTGTLTCNSLDFFKCSIGGVVYGSGTTEVEKSNASRGGVKLPEPYPEAAKYREPFFNFYDHRVMDGQWAKLPDAWIISMFGRGLSLCHTVIPQEDGGTVRYESESPDEAALVVAAKALGFYFHSRIGHMVTVRQSKVAGMLMDLPPPWAASRPPSDPSSSPWTVPHTQSDPIPPHGSIPSMPSADPSLSSGSSSAPPPELLTSKTHFHARAPAGAVTSGLPNSSLRPRVSSGQEDGNKSSSGTADDGDMILPHSTSSNTTPHSSCYASPVSMARARKSQGDALGKVDDARHRLSSRLQVSSGFWGAASAASSMTPKTSHQWQNCAVPGSPAGSGNLWAQWGGGYADSLPGVGSAGWSPNDTISAFEMEQEVDVDYEILNILEFSSERKRMSVIVLDPQGRTFIFCKGAEDVIYERLCPDHPLNVRHRDVSLSQLESFGDTGLRTLCIAFNELDPAFYQQWQADYLTARTSTSNADELVAQVADLVEVNMILLGSTAIEDKLQEGVPKAIADLAAANINFWVLTGDKTETAVNICHACNVLHSDMAMLRVSAECPEATSLRARGLAQQADHVASDYVGRVMHERLVHAVEVTELVRKSGTITLAIGDGANDISMIQRAHIGIGVSGQEGMQAVMASDFSISQFRFLVPLLLVHGRWSYKRTSHMVLLFMFKNMLFGVTIFVYNARTAFSGRSMYMDVLMALYSPIFTILMPVALGLFDRDVDRSTALRFPALYKHGQNNESFNWRKIGHWLLQATYQAVIVLLILACICGPFSDREGGQTCSIWQSGVVAYTMVLLVVHAQAARMITQWTIFHHVALWLSLALWFIFISLLSVLPIYLSNEAFHLFDGVVARAPSYWVSLLVAVVACGLPDYFVRHMRRLLSPNDTMLLQELQKSEARQKSNPASHMMLFDVEGAEGKLPDSVSLEDCSTPRQVLPSIVTNTSLLSRKQAKLVSLQMADDTPRSAFELVARAGSRPYRRYTDDPTSPNSVWDDSDVASTDKSEWRYLFQVPHVGTSRGAADHRSQDHHLKGSNQEPLRTGPMRYSESGSDEVARYSPPQAANVHVDGRPPPAGPSSHPHPDTRQLCSTNTPNPRLPSPTPAIGKPPKSSPPPSHSGQSSIPLILPPPPVGQQPTSRHQLPPGYQPAPTQLPPGYQPAPTHPPPGYQLPPNLPPHPASQQLPAGTHPTTSYSNPSQQSTDHGSYQHVSVRGSCPSRKSTGGGSTHSFDDLAAAAAATDTINN